MTSETRMDQQPIEFSCTLTSADHFWYCLYSSRRTLLKKMALWILIVIGIFYYMNRDRGDGWFFTLITDTHFVALFLVYVVPGFSVFMLLIDLLFYFIRLKFVTYKNKKLKNQETHYKFTDDKLEMKTDCSEGSVKYDFLYRVYLYKRHAVLSFGHFSYVIPYRGMTDETRERLTNLLSEIKKKIEKKKAKT